MSSDRTTIRFADSHVHWWDKSNEWLVTATQEQADAFGMGDISGMNRDYLPADYAEDTAPYEIPKVVWVTATLLPGGATPEARWASDLAQREPRLAAIIGSVDPTLPAGERNAQFAVQAADNRFRGVRVLAGLDWGSSSADDYMRMLADAGCVYDLVAHHESMPDAARLAERHPEVPWVLEHCGWPQHPDDPADVDAWREGIRVLASVGSVHCKLSGLAMALHSFDPYAQRPFLEHCLEAFGVERCMFGSNFPVDALYGNFDDLMRLYLDVAARLGEAASRLLFSENAERFYRI